MIKVEIKSKKEVTAITMAFHFNKPVSFHLNQVNLLIAH